MLFTNRQIFFSPDSATGAPVATEAETVATEAETVEETEETQASPEPKKKGKKAAPEPKPVTPPAAPEPAPENKDLKELIAAHAKAEALAGELQTEKAGRAADLARLEVYRAHALQSAQKAIDAAPEFVKSRVKLDEADPIKTLAEVDQLLGIYEAAKKELGAGGAGSAPAPSAGGVAPAKPKSVWEPVGPMPSKRR